MKLISTLRLTTSLNKAVTTISENCTMSQAFAMIENWCNDNNAQLPSPVNIYKSGGCVRVHVVTRDQKYINLFDIKD